jgi:hypothetical protein
MPVPPVTLCDRRPIEHLMAPHGRSRALAGVNRLSERAGYSDWRSFPARQGL